MTSLAERKKILRAEMRRRRSELDPDWIRRTSDCIGARLPDLEPFRRAAVVGVYLSTPSEVQTDAMLETCWEAAKKVCAPRWNPRVRAYGMAVLERNAGTEAGPGRCLQPREDSPAAPDRIEFWLVPGLAFDAEGGRLGHGGGHYDRLLSSPAAAGAFRLGLAFDFQIVARIPMGKDDVRLDAVLTEARVLRLPRGPDGG